MTAVYILISSGQDLYYEQLLVSLYSLRMHNPELNVVVLVDDVTERTLHGKRSKVRELANEIKVIAVPEGYSPKSQIAVHQDYFPQLPYWRPPFIDTDTVIADTLKDVENTDADVACVLDYHAPLDRQLDGIKIKQNVQSIFKEDVSDENIYYNSGVIWLKDTPVVRNLFDQWNHYWKVAAFEAGKCFDQPALMMADRKCGHIIKELDGSYNCQILTSIQYLNKAKILHFFNNVWQGKEQLSPFLGRGLYEEIKQTGDIPLYTKEMIADCKSAFYAPTYFTCKEQVEFMNDIVGATCFSSYLKCNLTYRFIRLFCRLRYNIAKHLSRK